jgi:ClpP class serine protease
MTMRERAVHRGEALAMLPSAIRPGREHGALVFAVGPEATPTSRVGDVSIVYVRGALEQHDDGLCDSYEAIIRRVTDAMDGGDDGPPAAVVMRISSPGGVVAGLFECVRSLRRLSGDRQIPLIAYVDELAASAAYALACACDEIYLPPSGMVGSIGVISHMWSMQRANDKAGIDVEVIASGAYKADGNEHVPITDDAVARERERVHALAAQFFSLVADARGVSDGYIESLEAGVFLGDDAVRAGLADVCMGWSEFESEIALAYSANRVTESPLPSERSMRTTIRAIIAQAKKDLASATTSAEKKALKDKIARLTASLADIDAYRKTRYVRETEEKSEEEDSEEDAEDESSESESDAESAEDESGSDAESAEDDGDDDKDDEENNEEAMMALFTRGLHGRKAEIARGVLKRLMDDAARGRAAAREVAEMARRAERDKLLAELETKTPRYVSRATAKWLRTQPNATIASYLRHAKTPIIHTEEDAMVPDDRSASRRDDGISAAMMEQFRAASAASGIPLEKFVSQYKANGAKPAY